MNFPCSHTPRVNDSEGQQQSFCCSNTDGFYLIIGVEHCEGDQLLLGE